MRLVIRREDVASSGSRFAFIAKKASVNCTSLSMGGALELCK